MLDWPNVLHRKEYSKYSLNFKPDYTDGEGKSPIYGTEKKILEIVLLILICPCLNSNTFTVFLYNTDHFSMCQEEYSVLYFYS